MHILQNSWEWDNDEEIDDGKEEDEEAPSFFVLFAGGV
jgi:hypothetical protein